MTIRFIGVVEDLVDTGTILGGDGETVCVKDNVSTSGAAQTKGVHNIKGGLSQPVIDRMG